MSAPSPSAVAQHAHEVSAEHQTRPGLIRRNFDTASKTSKAYLQTAEKEAPPCANTYLSHNKKHFGETPHTLRHLLRGGQITFLTNKEVETEVHDSKPPGGVAAALVKRIQDDTALKWEEIVPSTTPKSTDRKIGHSKIHHYQTPETAEAFAAQLVAEYFFPEMLKKLAGQGAYDAITQEVESYQFEPNTQALIIWCRDNRSIKDRLRAAEEREIKFWSPGAVEAVTKANPEKGLQVLLMGDKADYEYKGARDLRGHHVQQNGGTRRTILEQMLFLSAVIKASGACLAVGQRSGLLDLLSLVGGIPICQYLSSPNPRLEEVFVSGCGIGGAVVLDDKKTMKKIMETECNRQILMHKQLVVEINLFKEKSQLIEDPQIKVAEPCHESVGYYWHKLPTETKE
jgi:hypothetical protein